MLLVWFFMGLLDVLITEEWRKTAWLRLSMSTAVQSAKHVEILASPPPQKKNQLDPRGWLSYFETAGGLHGGEVEEKGGERFPPFHRGPSVSLVRMKTHPQIPNKRRTLGTTSQLPSRDGAPQSGAGEDGNREGGHRTRAGCPTEIRRPPDGDTSCCHRGRSWSVGGRGLVSLSH